MKHFRPKKVIPCVVPGKEEKKKAQFQDTFRDLLSRCGITPSLDLVILKASQRNRKSGLLQSDESGDGDGGSLGEEPAFVKTRRVQLCPGEFSFQSTFQLSKLIKSNITPQISEIFERLKCQHQNQ